MAIKPAKSRAQFPEFEWETCGRGTFVVYARLEDLFQLANDWIDAKRPLQILGVSLAQWAREAHEQHELLDHAWRSTFVQGGLDGLDRDKARAAANDVVLKMFLQRELAQVHRFEAMSQTEWYQAVRQLEEYAWIKPVRGEGPHMLWLAQDGTGFAGAPTPLKRPPAAPRPRDLFSTTPERHRQ